MILWKDFCSSSKKGKEKLNVLGDVSMSDPGQDFQAAPNYGKGKSGGKGKGEGKGKGKGRGSSGYRLSLSKDSAPST